MKRVGIVTIIDYYNYGNRLQNYAVSYLFNNRLGCKAVTLEGSTSRRVEGSILRYVKEQLALQLCRIPDVAEKKLSPKMIRWYNFSEWSSRWIPRRHVYSCEKLPKELNMQYDFFVSGSDQIWNYRIKDLRLEDYFLTFADDVKKNSISASFGVNEIPDKYRSYYSDNLSKFSKISVREESGAHIVKDLIGKDVPVLIDPVMMLSQDEWIHVEKKPRVDISKPYILEYYLGEKIAAINEWAEENGYEVYDLMKKNEAKLYSAGPGEFISLVRHASFICSDSFHCIAFAILFSRPFVVYERQGKEDYMLSRLETLLRKFGLENRWSWLLTPDEYLKCDFSEAKEKLICEQNKFMEYISEIVKN